MFPLTPEFMRQADPLSSQRAGNDSASDADQAQTGAFTLEYRDNPFASFMRKIERMIDTDPAGALRMANLALMDRVFGGKFEEKLLVKVDQLIDLVHKEGGKPDVSGPFMKSAISIVPPQAAAFPPGPVPYPVPAALPSR